DTKVLLRDEDSGRSFGRAGRMAARVRLVIAGSDQDPVSRLRSVDGRLDRVELPGDSSKAPNAQYVRAGTRGDEQRDAEDRSHSNNTTHSVSSRFRLAVQPVAILHLP